MLLLISKLIKEIIFVPYYLHCMEDNREFTSFSIIS